MNPSSNTKPLDIDLLIKRADENRITPAEALVLQRYLERQASPDGVLAPITLAKPTDVIPTAYVIHHWTTRCLACNDIQKHDEVFALNHLRSRFGTTLVRNLVPITKLEWNVPITEHIPVPKTIAFCAACLPEAQEFVATLPSPPAPQSITKFSNATEGSPALLAKPKKSGAFTSTDDLLI
jgi:hypothetical protein